MNQFKVIMTNLLGLATMGLMVYGLFIIIKNGVFNVPEMTFLMFVGFVLTSLFAMNTKD
jgi:hypothetical protein